MLGSYHFRSLWDLHAKIATWFLKKLKPRKRRKGSVTVHSLVKVTARLYQFTGLKMIMKATL
jgi:hypothetical protein